MNDLKSQKCRDAAQEAKHQLDQRPGKDAESAPWYHMFQGERINDHHLSLAEKKEARKQAEQKN